MGKDVIVACDFSSAEATFAFLDKFTGRKPFVKIGMELYYAEGPSIVREIKARGHKIFLDLKLHDIPNTVKKAMAVLSNLDVDITNLHAAGTTAMMQAALEGLTRPDGTRPLLIAVTQLTSTDQETMERDLLIKEPIDQVVMHYAETARNAGLDGVVCSPLEAGVVHETCGKDFFTVTPGVRFADGEIGDQKRVMTPAQAKEIGSDYIVGLRRCHNTLLIANIAISEADTGGNGQEVLTTSIMYLACFQRRTNNAIQASFLCTLGIVHNHLVDRLLNQQIHERISHMPQPDPRRR